MRRRADFLRCYRSGDRHHGALLRLHFHPNDERIARLGITASRKVGKAVVRHRLKRRVREIFRTWNRRAELPALDVVVHLKPEAGKSDFQALKTELERLLSRLVDPEPRRRSSSRGRVSKNATSRASMPRQGSSL